MLTDSSGDTFQLIWHPAESDSSSISSIGVFMDYFTASIIIGVLAIALILVLVILAIKSSNQRKREEEKSRAHTPARFAVLLRTPDSTSPDSPYNHDRLLIGDAVYTSAGTVTVHNRSSQWDLLWLTIADTEGWLSYDPNMQRTVYWTEIETDLEPGQKTLTIDGTNYSLAESVVTTYAARGTTGLPASGKVEHFDYFSSDGEPLNFKRFNGGNWEASMGYVL